ncbi:uronyl 2-sulfotransferase-like isoform X2 [Lytechinus pictus]|uniref:uronyl 2-sulfotransferase-like isoform X2 n=1 Tax=Lytechinus pictus TaxID=7653 RepID=UPI0030B9CF7F
MFHRVLLEKCWFRWMDTCKRRENDALFGEVSFLNNGHLMATCLVASRMVKYRVIVLLMFVIVAGVFLGWNSRMDGTTTQDLRRVNQLSAMQSVTVSNDTMVDAIGPRYECTEGEIKEDDKDEDEMIVYGKPIHGKNKTVLYVSMPKCGSRTFVWMISYLRAAHHFGKPVNIDYMLARHQISEVRTHLSSKLLEAEDGAILHGHYRYINMKRHGDLDMSKEELVKNIKTESNMALPNETLDECIAKGRLECTLSLYRNMYITSFCGYAPGCSESPSFAFEEAKRNVDKFLVIGVMEEYDLSMAVFEKLLPGTFGGAAKIYEESKNQPMTKFKTSYKKLPSKETYSILKERMKYDYKFYDYVKERLHRVARRLEIGKCNSIW